MILFLNMTENKTKFTEKKELLIECQMKGKLMYTKCERNRLTKKKLQNRIYNEFGNLSENE